MVRGHWDICGHWQPPDQHHLGAIPRPVGTSSLSSSQATKKPGSVLIVGGGVAGLQTARALQKQGIDFTILERNDDVGGVWRDNYEGYALQGRCWWGEGITQTAVCMKRNVRACAWEPSGHHATTHPRSPSQFPISFTNSLSFATPNHTSSNSWSILMGVRFRNTFKTTPPTFSSGPTSSSGPILCPLSVHKVREGKGRTIGLLCMCLYKFSQGNGRGGQLGPSVHVYTHALYEQVNVCTCTSHHSAICVHPFTSPVYHPPHRCVGCDMAPNTRGRQDC